MTKAKSGPIKRNQFKNQQEEKRRRVAECLALHKAGKSIDQIASQTGYAVSSVSRYLSEHENDCEMVIKPPPKTRKCLRCRMTFKPRTFGIFMCNSCNNFARGVMV